MTVDEAFKKLNIEDYSERIFNSNSHGELFHLLDYINIAHQLGEDSDWFRPWFVEVIKFAEANWKRPESVFQHIPQLLSDSFQPKAQP